MRYNCTKIVTLLLLLLVVNSVFAQDRFTDLEKRLNELIPELPGLNEKIDISVNGTSIQEFIRGIANNSGVNINVDPSINVSIVNNFTNVKVLDVLLYLTKQYNLEITTIGNILTVKSFEVPKQAKPLQIDEILIKYDSKNDFLSYELANDTLWKVLKEITRLSGKNVVAPAKLNSKIVNGYIQNMPFENVLEKLAITNDLVYEKTDDRFYVLSEKGIEAKQGSSGDNISGDKKKSDKSGSEANNSVIKTFGTNSISIFAKDISIPWIIKRISDTLNVNYVIVDELEGKKDINVQNIDYNNFLLRLLDGTKFSYNTINDVYIIGKSENLSILNTKLIKLQYRSVDKIVEHIPDEIKKGINVKEFPELNCIVVTGPQSRIDVVENFIRDIDKIVPVILIEVLIVDYNKNNSVVTAINAGIGTNPNPASQTILPGISYQFSTQSLNNLLGQFEGFGWFNLGKVTEDFYLSIKALETNGVIDIRSTPKLSTLNGHEANMSSGETKYYKEEKSNYIGTQNPSLANSYTWNPIKADLSLLIKPFVSGDEYITLEIEVSQSSFTPREFTDSPPGSVTRTFKSMIRMLDGEMILLGGIEKESSQNIGSGTPILSRIPIIKWFFSSKTKSNDKSRLNIFIKPTIIF